MDNRFDNIEDSIRKAFDGFELPVNDADWNAIANGLKDNGGAKKGFVVWWNEKKKRNWLLAALLLLLVGSATWYFVSPEHKSTAPAGSNIQEKSTPMASKKPASAIDNGAASNNSASNTSNINKADNTGTTNNTGAHGQTTMADGNSTAAGSNGTRVSGDNTKPVGQAKQSAPEVTVAPDKGTTVTRQNPNEGVKTQTTENPQDVSKPTPEDNTTNVLPPDIIFRLSQISTLARQMTPQTIKPARMEWPQLATPNIMNDHMRSVAHKPMLGWELYGSMQSSLDRSKANATAGSSVWDGIHMLGYSNNFTTVRFEAGTAYNTGKWRLGIGGAFETGTAYKDKSNDEDSVMVLRARKFIPYMDSHGTILYWLATKWDTVYIMTRRQPRVSWAEVPLSITRKFDLGNDWRLNAGVTNNFGFMTSASGDIANPYQYYSGSYVSYNYGIKNADTTSVSAQASDFMRKFRFGNSLQLGLEKQMGMLNWGVQLQSRYYYTPVWKNGVPLNQHTFNYGINIRIGVKF